MRGRFYSIYNTELYLTVCVKSGPNNYRNCDIYFSEFKNENWNDLESIGDHINGLYTWESQLPYLQMVICWFLLLIGMVVSVNRFIV